MVGWVGGWVAGKAEIITNSAQLGLGLGLSLAITQEAENLTKRLTAIKFLDEQEVIWTQLGRSLQHGMRTENLTIIQQSIKQGYQSFITNMIKSSSGLACSRNLQIEMDTLLLEFQTISNALDNQENHIPTQVDPDEFL